MNVFIIDDVLQLISQYCPKVYCTLRLVSKEVKETVDEVLPRGFPTLNKRRDRWRVRFLQNADWCGFQLLDRNEFDVWIIAMDSVYGKDRKYGERVERFCRDYLPRNGIIGRHVLNVLCRLNRVSFVKSLWNEAVDKKVRFYSSCIQEICMLDDLEFVKMVHGEFYDAADIKTDALKVMSRFSIQKALAHDRWENILYLLEQHPGMRSDAVLKRQAKIQIALGCWKMFQHVVSHRKDKEAVMEAVKTDGRLILFADESLRKDKQFVLEAVQWDGRALQYVDQSLQNDREVFLKAVNQSLFAMAFSDQFRKDRDLVIGIVKKNGCALAFAHKSLRKDKDFVMEAIKQNGWALQYTDASIQQDRKLAMVAVKQNGSALQYVHESLRNDKEIVLEAVKQSADALRYADQSLRNDKEIVMEAVKQKGYTLEFADASLRRDKEIVLEAVKQDGYALQYVDDSLRRDKDVVREAVKQNGRALLFDDYLLKERMKQSSTDVKQSSTD